MAKSKGLGDSLEKIIKLTGLDSFVNGEDCGCNERKEKLNKIFPYKNKLIGRCLTEDEFVRWKFFTDNKTLDFSPEQISFICNLYATVFDKPLWVPEPNTSIKPIITMIDRLDLIYKTYGEK